MVACGIFSCSMWDLVFWPGIEPRPPALGRSCLLSLWTTSEDAKYFFLKILVIFIFWPCHETYRILVLQSGIKQSSNHWTTRELPYQLLLMKCCLSLSSHLWPPREFPMTKRQRENSGLVLRWVSLPVWCKLKMVTCCTSTQSRYSSPGQ